MTPILAGSVSGPEAARLRACAEARYRCGRATLVFVHAHKGGGTTFVAMARGNSAGLAKAERNGDPVVGGRRKEWWRLDPTRQARWFRELRRRQRVRFVSTEKGFPAADRLLAPVDVIYAIVVREPVSRFVSYYFWRWRDKSWTSSLALALARNVSTLTATLAPNAPTFEAFVASEAPLDGYYVRRLTGIADDAATVTEADLHAATRVLEDTFSLVLITERLRDFGPLVRDVLGWPHTQFDRFHKKSNPPPDVARLRLWRPDWRDHIASHMPLDSRFYQHASTLARDRLLSSSATSSASSPGGRKTSSSSPRRRRRRL